jgi:hypothetical protein
MTIIELKDKQISPGEGKLSGLYSQLGALLNELKKKDLPQNVISAINECIETLNASACTGTELRKLAKQKQTAILKKVEKESKIVPKNYYRTLWMLFGISGFGLPIGVAIGLSIGNIGLLGLGLPIGMAIGLIVGSGMDKKALKEGRQLDIEVKY